MLILLQPLVVLGFTAIALYVPSLTGNSNPGFHGISQVFYEYTSAFANNGSGFFEGLGDATPWWNLSCVLLLLLGRYPALLVPLAIAARMASKRVAPEGGGTLPGGDADLRADFDRGRSDPNRPAIMPALVLGPIAEHLTLAVR